MTPSFEAVNFESITQATFWLEDVLVFSARLPSTNVFRPSPQNRLIISTVATIAVEMQPRLSKRLVLLSKN